MALWNGQLAKTLRHLSDLRVWTWNARADLSWLEHVRTHLSALTSYLDAYADSLPNYGARYRAGTTISTACAESSVSSNHRDADDQAAADALESRDRPAVLNGSRAVLNETLEQAFRFWHAGFRTVEGSCAA